ncbi:MAG: ABC transporter ATP-binding protein [Xanthobacteraceae bacterium]|nr:ABC transporter ATP-binding protein [Xanthobacteraceae bacterium]QYK45687.1 MAG: ABC transporter ATP-binding protein [Xanthobacteraceae bacterium]
MRSLGATARKVRLTVSNDARPLPASPVSFQSGPAVSEFGKPALSVENVSVTYKSSRGKHTAVDDVSMKMHPGEFVSILGPSGCGKSTLLGVVAGLLSASSGRISIFGEEVIGPRKDIGVVFQQATLLPWLNVIDNILIPIKALRRNDRDYAKRAKDLLELVGLTKFEKYYPNELSGGMQQRVGIARALIHDPNLLLMDEPFAALDAMTRERMSLELQDIWRASGKSVLFITHSIPEAVFLSSRILIMSASPGRFVKEITIDLPRPRTAQTMASGQYAALCGEIRKMFDH